MKSNLLEIENFLRHLLLTKFKVILPGVGTILIKEEISKFDREKKSISAPVLKIIFNDKISEENQDLSGELREFFNVSEEEAICQLRDYSEKIFRGLNQDKQYEISGIGVLFLDTREKLCFLPNQSIVDLVNCNSEETVPVFNYPVIETTEQIKPSVLTSPAIQTPVTDSLLQVEHKTKFYQNKKILIPSLVCLSIILTLLFINHGWLINLKSDSDVKPQDKDNVLALADSTLWDQVHLDSSLIDDTMKVISASIKDTLPLLTRADYFVIIASFENLGNAENYAISMNKKGINTSMFAPFGGGNLYRISAGNFTNKEEAKIKSDELKNQYNLLSWILSLTNNQN